MHGAATDGAHLSRDLGSAIDDDHPFIVLTETKFSLRYIPVWARYSPLRTRVEKKKAHAIMLLPLPHRCTGDSPTPWVNSVEY